MGSRKRRMDSTLGALCPRPPVGYGVARDTRSALAMPIANSDRLTSRPAADIHFGIEWEAVKKLGVYRRYIADDGCGMDEVELVKFFSTLGVGNKPIGGVHKNFGVGAKIAMLPWNPKGLVVLSWKDGKASMIWIELDTNTGEYELCEFETDTGATCVIDPEAVEWREEEVDWG